MGALLLPGLALLALAALLPHVAGAVAPSAIRAATWTGTALLAGIGALASYGLWEASTCVSRHMAAGTYRDQCDWEWIGQIVAGYGLAASLAALAVLWISATFALRSAP